MRTTGAFRPAWWLPGPHLQTLYPSLFRKRLAPPLQRERIELPDGDFLDIDWTRDQAGPVVVLLHGLEGSLRSHYISGLLHTLSASGLRAAVLYFRGCSGEPNRLARSYHSGESGDLDRVLKHLAASGRRVPIYLVGVSLGGNVLLKWLGEHPHQTLVSKAVAVSVPFELNAAALRLQRGFSRVYQAYLLRRLRHKTRRKAQHHVLPVASSRLGRLRTFRAFDHEVTAPLHGFSGVDHYYTTCSSRAYLRHIATPTLLLQAQNDPFLTTDALPSEAELGPGVRLELCRDGGHAGFVSGPWPWKPYYWLDARIRAFLCEAPGSPDIV
jgi:predicted alpha/beta-fold hydrolase